MIEVKLLKIQGHAAIVTFRDEVGTFHARIVSTDDVAGMRIGETKVVPYSVVKYGTEYGIDWDTLLGKDYAITPDDICQEFRRHGLWTYDDMNKNPQQVTAALRSVTMKVYAELLRQARTLK